MNRSDFYTFTFSTRRVTMDTSDMPSSICGNIRLDHHLEMVLPDGFTIQSPQHSSLSRISSERFSLNNVHSISSPIKKSASEKSPYSGWTLRPIPPHRGEWLPGSANDTNVQQQIKLRKGRMNILVEERINSAPNLQLHQKSKRMHNC